MLSTENLDNLPKPNDLQRICMSISALEAIISPEWEYRYYSYQKDWGEGEEFCEMRDGQGDQMLILFTKNGICINGFAHESQMNGWKQIQIEEKKSFKEKLFGTKNELKTELRQEIFNGVLDSLPEVFNEFIYGEPVKSIGTTFCIWSIENDWKIGEIKLPNDNYKDGSKDLLQLLDGQAKTYKNWAEEYYEKEFKIELIESVYAGNPISKELVLELNSEIEDLEALRTELVEIGFANKL